MKLLESIKESVKTYRDQAALHSAALKEYRDSHPAEAQVNQTHGGPRVEFGKTFDGPVKGAHAELFDGNARRAWTGTRLAGNAVGVMSLGTVPFFSGRKKLGAAAVNVYYADGTAKSYPVSPENLGAANAYVVAFNAYAAQLAKEK